MTRRQRQDLDNWAPSERATFTDAETEKVTKSQPVIEQVAS